MELIPYDAPLLPEYRTAVFRQQTAKWVPKIRSEIAKGRGFFETDPATWVQFNPSLGHRAPRSRWSWQPKVYICLRASSYWRFLMDFIRGREGFPVVWKFFLRRKGYDRPDKLVVYPKSSSELRSVVRALRPALAGHRFHQLRHAASTVELGLEANGNEGLYVGCDPCFLKGISWRRYRCFVGAWACLNDAGLQSLPGGKERWFRRMNLSSSHEGPHSLEPDVKDIHYVSRYWRGINA